MAALKHATEWIAQFEDWAPTLAAFERENAYALLYDAAQFFCYCWPDCPVDPQVLQREAWCDLLNNRRPPILDALAWRRQFNI